MGDSPADMKKALAAYLAIGVVIFAPILTAWFVTDDWEFLVLAGTAKSAAICFAPIVGAYLRPIVMAIFYVNYHMFGLNPIPYHLTIVLLHAINAWFVCLLATRLGLSRMVALGAGLIFLVFAGHSEAVSWLGGESETVMTALLVPALLLFDRALMAERAGAATVGACLMFALCMLGKETGVIVPALLAAYGASRLLMPLDAAGRRRTIVRTGTVVGLTSAIAASYLGFRMWMFGTIFGTYPEVAPREILFAESRAFLLRSFLPAGRTLAYLWTRGYDRVLIVATALWLALVFVRRPDTRRPLAFLLIALGVALAPVLPASISISNTVTERYVYTATVFSCILIAWCVEFVCGRRRVLAGVLIVVVALVNLRALERANRGWVAAGRLSRTITTELIARVRAVAPPVRTFVMNVPDTAAGMFVVRGAFYASFRLMAPDVASPDRRIAMIASTAEASPTEHTRVERTGARSFAVTPAGAVFLQTRAIATPEYSFQDWDPHRYAVTFAQTPHAVQVLYTSDGHVRTAAILPGAPSGFMDMPPRDSTCTGDALRFSGWAVDDEPGVDVVVERAHLPPGAGSLGSAMWKTGTRPDVTALYPDLPGSDRAEWNVMLPCSVVRAAGGRLEVRVAAVGRDGRRSDLGTRIVTSR